MDYYIKNNTSTNSRGLQLTEPLVTDGSKNNKDVGDAFFDIQLNDFSVDHDKFVILSDSKSALQHLAWCVSGTRDMPIAYKILKVSQSIHGNEQADELTNLAIIHGEEMPCKPYSTELIIDGKLYRQKDCHFPARCAGVEHYLSALAPKLPNMELAINTRDWPQVNHAWGHLEAPVFSFSKTKDYHDIMYPAWSFWEGGPAIALYPNGIGRWDKHRLSISAAAERWPWNKKEQKGFFRGSRTSEERDTLVRLSRQMPELVDAQYTKNQAWKSKADTLGAEPAAEVSFDDHCKYKYLFNYRGVAASFRFKHLFLCKSLIFHVGSEWQEFFYPILKPWVHYIPLSPQAIQSEIAQYITFFQENDYLAEAIAERGYQFIWENLTAKDVKCYWRQLLKKYVNLVKYNIVRDPDLIEIT